VDKPVYSKQANILSGVNPLEACGIALKIMSYGVIDLKLAYPLQQPHKPSNTL